MRRYLNELNIHNSTSEEIEMREMYDRHVHLDIKKVPNFRLSSGFIQKSRNYYHKFTMMILVFQDPYYSTKVWGGKYVLGQPVSVSAVEGLNPRSNLVKRFFMGTPGISVDELVFKIVPLDYDLNANRDKLKLVCENYIKYYSIRAIPKLVFVNGTYKSKKTFPEAFIYDLKESVSVISSNTIEKFIEDYQ
jgi:hypothetical protein